MRTCFCKILCLLLAIACVASFSACRRVTSADNETTEVTNLYVYNWGEYIDEDTLDLFEEEYPEYHVVYDTFATNEEMYQKIVSGGLSYDVLIPSDYMIEKMIGEDLLAEIDVTKLENYDKIDDNFKNADFDPENKYSVPYIWGTLGILYNTTMVDEEPDSWGILFDEQYEGRILMLESIRDTLGFALCYLGYSFNTTNADEIAEARDLLIQGKHLYADWGVDTNKDPMKNGNYALTVTYSGDAMDLMCENEDLAYVVPKEGSNVWIDSMVIPKNSKNYEGAVRFIDFMCRTDIATMNAEEIGYSTPQKEALLNLGEEYINDPTYNPPQELLDKCNFFKDVGEYLTLYNEAWEKIRLY